MPPSAIQSLPYDSSRPLRAEDGLMYMLRDALLAVSQCVNERADLTGSTLPQWLPLHKVHAGHADTVAELARVCTIDTGAMTRLLDRLERKGLCQRVRSQSDRRVVHIELTPAGVAVAERVPHILCEVYNQVLAGFSPQEWEQLRTLLLRLTEAAQNLLAHEDAS
ncbi:MarR family winged helix-turn-helix transcriptional regulator [Ottowia sp.]|uniref:MarR family winged helix-turn-helix transcriptional regulator n=1 Tax=Ottowia sp. TaxID=1898956 RepID=UPI00393700F7